MFPHSVFPKPPKEKTTSPIGNCVTLGDTKPYKKGQQNSIAKKVRDPFLSNKETFNYVLLGVM